jgi:hypothetical protein
MAQDREDLSTRERRAREEAEAAAREAGRIGGPRSSSTTDEANRPLAEAGGGVAEGFEQAEQDLIEHASHGDPSPDPSQEAFEPESDDEGAVERGSRDHEHSTQRRNERQTG